MKTVMLILVALLLFGIPASAQPESPAPYYFGVDLSYVNEMEDCGAVYRVDGEPRDPYEIFHDAGANLVRLRLWHTPDWTEYSTLDDVTRAIERAKALDMTVLLDFHYSDTWADPGKQIIPAAWEGLDDEALGDAVYEYTYESLMHLDGLGLMPDIVQVGNEINSEILRAEGTSGTPINWERNAALINQGIRAVRDAGEAGASAPQVMLHIAQPENVEGWLRSARRTGVTDFDIIGVSYYPGWSDHTIRTIDNVMRRLGDLFEKDVMIVETSYPWTLDGVNESAGNILGEDFLDPDYPATPEGQRQFMIDLNQAVIDGGGIGVIYWEPAWVSTPCETLWGTGSHWENATVFDFTDGNELHEGIEYLTHEYTFPEETP